MVKNSPPNAGDRRDRGSIPGQEDALEEGMETDSSILAWRFPWREEPDIFSILTVWPLQEVMEMESYSM